MKRPFWVEVGMIGVKSRSTALVWFYLSLSLIIIAPIAVFTGLTIFKNAPLFPAIGRSLLGAVIAALTVLWYWFCIKWMDENRAWTQ
ncbi:MAG TPA: hypothetical protein VF599_04150 [Pyrinomonadaceae bacterium]|jgi:hypothetical protein